MTPRSPRGERGAVMVIMALALFTMAAMMTFAIDVSHWFDYSRNLQNRADAAALAAGGAYGNICFTDNTGDTQTGAQSAVGKWAQLYSGAGVAEPVGNLPYTDAQVSAPVINPLAGGPGTGWNVTANGYINNTLPGSSPDSPLTLKAGSLSDYSLRLNADNFATDGGTNFVMGDFCNGDPTYDATDKQCFGQAHGQTTGPCAVGPMADAKVTQAHLPNFIQIFNIHPNISAHARVALQGLQSEKGVRPLAVGDASYIPCIKANFLNNDGVVIASEKLTRVGTSDTWTSVGDAKQIQIPTANTNPVTVQLFLWDCNSSNPSGATYDYYDDKGMEHQLGLVYINNWGTPGAVGANGSPQIAAGGVHLTGNQTIGTTCDPYFQSSTSACEIGVHANIQFQPAQPGVTAFYARALIDGKTASAIQLDPNTPGPTDWDSDLNTFTVPADSGAHTITIQWAQLGGSTAGGACKPLNFAGDKFGNGNQNCTGTFGQNGTQRTFAGVNGTNACNNPGFDTGPTQWIDIGTTDNPAASAGANAYAQGANPHLYITTSIQGLSNSQPTDPNLCLRVAVQTQHGTGFIDCGQGNGGNQDQQAILNGCPVPPGVQKNVRVQADGSLICTPTITPWDCVGNDPGESPPILRAFDDLIGKGGAPSTCAPNNWGKTDGDGNPVPITLADPRAIVMVITAPLDLQDQNGSAGQKIPIRDFAVFYVTGWSSKVSGFPQGGVKGCANNDSAPSGAVDGEIWGHWTSVAVPAGLGTTNGETCDTDGFGNCIAVLTR